MKKVFIIAEAGVNHNGSMEIAKRLVDAAKDSGADAVKFQTFQADKLVSKNAEKAEYQKNTTDRGETQYQMIKKLELSFESHRELIKYCKEREIKFLSSPFDIESIDALVGLGLDSLKIPSGEITNLPYLRRIGQFKGRIILSTGMSDIGEIEDALDVLAKAGTLKDNITVLHCNTEYPTPYGDVNLRAMLTIKNTFKIDVGYSDHTLGIEVPIAAVALGATVIEKHFTLDKTMAGPDHKASLNPIELKAMVNAIRNIEKAIGDGVKRPSQSEMKNRPIGRKSIVALKKIQKGEIFTDENITVKRPGTGISPMLWDQVIGKHSAFDFAEDDLIKLS